MNPLLRFIVYRRCPREASEWVADVARWCAPECQLWGTKMIGSFFTFEKIPAPMKIKLALPPPPSRKPQHPPPSLKRRILWAWGFFSRKNPKKNQAPIKFGAAISAPRITGGKITDITLFQILTVRVFFCLQSLKALIRRTLPL